MNTVASNYGLTGLKINGLDITPQNVEVINIFEGLTSPALTGQMIIKDREGLLEIREVFAGDSIEIKFTSKADVTDMFEFKGIISNATGVISNDATFPTTTIEFCSKWWFNAISKQISKAYKNVTLGDILDDIIEEECDGKYFGDIPASSEIIERFVTPYWTPAHILKEIMSWASASPTQTGYTLYDNLKDSKVYCIALDTLLNGDMGVHPSELVVGAANIIYEGSVDQINMESYFDAMRYLNQGLLNTEFVSFDYDNTKVYKSKADIHDVDFTHLASTVPLKKEYIDNYNSVQHTWGKPINQKQRLTNKQFANSIDTRRNILYSNLLTDLLKFNVVVPGATDRSCGQLVKLEIPSINANADQKSRHKFLEGYYLIRNINHVFKNDTYSQVMTLCRDGFGDLNRKDLINWKKISDIEMPTPKAERAK